MVPGISDDDAASIPSAGADEIPDDTEFDESEAASGEDDAAAESDTNGEGADGITSSRFPRVVTHSKRRRHDPDVSKDCDDCNGPILGDEELCCNGPGCDSKVS